MRLKTDKPRGVLAPGGAALPFVHQRFEASAALQPWVEHFWSVTWDVAEPYEISTLPHPSVHLSFEGGRAALTGVTTGRFTQTLRGKGSVFAIKFRPASFRAFTAEPLRTLTDRVVDPTTVFGADFLPLARAVGEAETLAEKVTLTEAFLLDHKPVQDPVAARLNTVLQALATTPSVTRVAEIPLPADVSLRQLQRLFLTYIGVSPKWVIARYRIHEALERVQGNEAPAWAGLAADLGYADQAHFIRDFKGLIGVSPARYARAK